MYIVLQQEEQQKCQILQKDLVQQEVDIKQQFNEQLRQLEEDKVCNVQYMHMYTCI